MLSVVGLPYGRTKGKFRVFEMAAPPHAAPPVTYLLLHQDGYKELAENPRKPRLRPLGASRRIPHVQDCRHRRHCARQQHRTQAWVNRYSRSRRG